VTEHGHYLVCVFIMDGTPLALTDLPDELLRGIVVKRPLQRQVLGLTCKRLRKIYGRLSKDILDYLPEAWNRDTFDHDPCGDYYYGLLYRALREAPEWLHTWTMGTSKTISSLRGMTLALTWSPPIKTDSVFIFYKLSNGGLPWKFKATSTQFKCIFDHVQYRQ
jgi:hypothetical protein